MIGDPEEGQIETTSEETESPKETESPQIDVQALLQDKAKLETELAQLRKGLSSAHQTTQQRDRELKKYQAIEQEMADLKEIVALSLSNRSSEETPDNGVPNVLQEIEKKRQLRQKEFSQQEADSQRLAYNSRADIIWARAQVAISDADALEDIKEMLSNGMAGMADRQVAKVERTLKASPKQTEADRQKEIEEAARKMLEASGQLAKTGANLVGGSKGKIWTTTEVVAMDTPTYLKNFPNGGADIISLMAEGKIIDK